MERKPLLVAMMVGLLMGALWLALPTTARAQCGPGGTFPCPPAPEREKKPTAADRPVTPTPTLTRTPRPTPTSTPTAVLVAPAGPPPAALPYSKTKIIIETNPLLGGGLLLLLLLGAILGVLINRFRRNTPGPSFFGRLGRAPGGQPILDDVMATLPEPHTLDVPVWMNAPEPERPGVLPIVDPFHVPEDGMPAIINPDNPDAPAMTNPDNPDMHGTEDPDKLYRLGKADPSAPDLPTGLGGHDR